MDPIQTRPAVEIGVKAEDRLNAAMLHDGNHELTSLADSERSPRLAKRLLSRWGSLRRRCLVLVQREMENWRSPLASIPPSSAGQLGEHRATQVAAGELGGD